MRLARSPSAPWPRTSSRGCQLETFCFRSVDERVDAMSGKLGVSKQSVAPGIKSDATLLAAVHLLLALRSIVAPVTAAGNVRAEQKFTTWIMKYPGGGSASSA